MKVTLVKTKNDSLFDVLGSNGVKFGEALHDVDGFLYFDPDKRGQLFSAEALSLIAEALNEANRPWQEIINKTLGQKCP